MKSCRQFCAGIFAAMLMSASGADASVTYTYVGLNWGDAGGGVSGDSTNIPPELRAIRNQQHITFSMILSDSLAPGGSYNLVNDPRLLSFSMNDGRLTVTQANARYFSIFIRLDNDDDIVAWDVAEGANFDLGALGLYALDLQAATSPSPLIGTADFAVLQRCTQLTGSLCSDPLGTSTGQVFRPGRWTAPEPGTLALVSVALIGFAVARSRGRRSLADTLAGNGRRFIMRTRSLRDRFRRVAPHFLRLVFFMSLGYSCAAGATLIPRLGGQAVYDTDLNITWLANANLAATNTFGVAGIFPQGNMTWNTAQSWIAAMSAANFLGFDNWRLPITLEPDPSCSIQNIRGIAGQSGGFNCTGSEMGHLFYTATAPFPFSNIQPVYWSATEFAPDPSLAWYFDLVFFRFQNVNFTFNTEFAWAARPGDVLAEVPEPASLALAVIALAAFAITGRRRKLIEPDCGT